MGLNIEINRAILYRSDKYIDKVVLVLVDDCRHGAIR
jgi:hypothetical protein